jgi:lactoylglutathione lyase
MDLGAFSLSLSVKDLAVSRAFYEKLGFTVYFDQAPNNWLIMKNGDCTIGLFQGMFEKNILTFNPGWDKDANPVEPYTDVRELQKKLQAQGLKLDEAADENSTGPAYVLLHDPDGNPIMLDQHV